MDIENKTNYNSFEEKLNENFPRFLFKYNEEFYTTLSFYCFLTTIDFSETRLKIIPEDFCNLSVLDECYLSKNKLEELPNNFHQLKMLRILRLDNNKLSCIASYFNDFRDLFILDLYNNEIVDVYCDLNRLNCLDIALNFIEESETDTYVQQKHSLRKKYNCHFRNDGSKPPYDLNQYMQDNPDLIVNSDHEEVWDSDGSWELDFKLCDGPTLKHPMQTLLEASMASGRFCPADMHQKPIPKKESFIFEYEPGDFDDASEDEIS